MMSPEMAGGGSSREANEPAPTSIEDARLVAELEQYAAALAEGRPTDRDSLTTRYPQIAEELAACLDTLEMVHRAGSQWRGFLAPGEAVDGSSRANAWAEFATLGDFRLLRELGRGGMGIVYEAQQISLRRRVALKILPFAAVLDPKQLHRFKNEAAAAASLNHPNIVGIYSVGCDRGVHYYAMGYVEGRSLAHLIEELRQLKGVHDPAAAAPTVSQVTENLASGRLASADAGDSSDDLDVVESPSPGVGPPRAPEGTSSGTREFFRGAARLGIQAADALEHAHQMGIVHRDIKPSNLLVNAQGHLWVTDFGLAMTQAGSGLTMTGALLGTYRYMSPEQAQGRQGVLGHRTDIYSLGATLYELLALRPAFEGDDREAVLRAVLNDDPPPLRAINRSIPRDLETIVLKAMAKEPAARYASAAEMAADLQRFVDNRPVLARRPSWLGRLAKWARRHQALVWSLAAALALVMVMLVASNLLIARERRRADRAYENERRHRQLADRQRALADRQRDEARRNLYMANMRIAPRYLEEGMVGGLYDLLDPLVPRAGEADLRGWEWYYLLAQCCGRGHPLVGHAHEVHAVSWSPDGTSLASGSVDGTLRIWDPLGRREVSWLGHGHVGQPIECISWSPSGHAIAAVSRIGGAGRVDLLRLSDSKRLLSVDGVGVSTHPRISVAWRPDGRLFAVSCGSEVRVYDAQTGEVENTFSVGDAPAESVGWSPSGEYLARTGSSAVQVWSADGDRPRWTFQRAGRCTMVSWSPDGEQLAVGTTADYILILDAATGHEAMRLASSETLPYIVAWNPRWPVLAVAGLGSERIALWQTKTGERVDELTGHMAPIRSLAWSPDGRRLASAGVDSIRLWQFDGPSGPEPPRVQDVGAAVWSSDGQFVIAACDGDRPTIAFVEAATGFVARSFAAAHRVLGLAAAPTGRYLAAAAADAAMPVGIYDAATGGVVQRAPFELGQPRYLAWSGDARHLAVASLTAVRIWDMVQKRYVATWRPPVQARVMLVASDGDAGFFAGCTDRLVGLTPTGQAKATFSVAAQLDIQQRGMAISSNRSHALSHDRQRLLYGIGADAYVCRIPGGDVLARLRGLHGGIVAADWSADGNRVLTVDDEGELRIWDPSGGQEMLRLGTAAEQMAGAAWSPDGSSIAGWTREGKLRFWRAARGYQAAEPVAYGLAQAERLAVGGAAVEALARLASLAGAYPERLDCRLAVLRARLRYAIDLERVGRYGEAIEQLGAAIAAGRRSASDSVPWLLRPELGLAFYRRRAIYEKNGQHALALADYQAATSVGHPMSAAQCRAWAECYRAAGRYAEAVAELTQATRLDPRSIHNWHSLAHTHAAMGKLDLALDDYAQQLRLSPANVDALEERAAILYKLKRYDEAAGAYSRLLEVSPQHAAARNRLAWLLAIDPSTPGHEAGRAVELAQGAVRARPDSTAFVNTLGAAQYRAGQYAASRQTLEEKCRAYPPGDGHDWVFLSMACVRLGDLPAARRWYEQALAWMASHGAGHGELAAVYAEAARLIGNEEGSIRERQSAGQ